MTANHGRVLASTTPLEPGFATWLQRFRHEECPLADHDKCRLAWHDLARLAVEEEWEDGWGFVFYFLEIPREAERALKSAWQRYVIELRHQGQAASHAAGQAFTTADLMGRRRHNVARHIAEKVTRPVAPCCRSKHEMAACSWCKQEWHGRVFDLAASCVEFGYPDAHIVYLVRASAVAVELWGESAIARYRQTTYIVRKQRRLHQHVGRKCSTVGCPSTPDWMKQDARTR